MRILICYVPKKAGDDGNAEDGARYFSGQLQWINGGGAGFQVPTATPMALSDAVNTSKFSAEFQRDTTTLMVIGHGLPVYQACMEQEFFPFLRRFSVLQSLIFIACELDKQHLTMPGFEANIINLLVKSMGAAVKVYASKTNVAYAVLNAQGFVWMHTPMAHLVPTRETTVVRKDPQEKDVEDVMDIFSSN